MKKILLKIKKIIKCLDFFGSEFTFDYKKENKYKSFTGGIVFFIVGICLIAFVLINLSSLINKSNKDVIFYNMKYPNTEEISFKNFSSTIAIRVSCGNDEVNEELKDLIKLKIEYIKMIKENGIYLKEKKDIEFEKCNYNIFYNNQFNSDFDRIGLNNFYCPNIPYNYTINGIYSNEIFSYFQFSITAYNSNKYDRLKYLLQNEECEVELYWIDIAIDSDNYKEPIRRYIDGVYFILKGNEYIKTNIYFKQQHFISDENLFFESKNPQYFIGYDYMESFSLYKGEDRFNTQPNDYSYLAKIYIRSSLNKNIIQRKYLKATEFLANTTSFFSSFYVFFKIFIESLNFYFARQEIIKNIFEFNEKNDESEEIMENPSNTYIYKQGVKIGIKINSYIHNLKNFNKKRKISQFQSINNNSNQLNTGNNLNAIIYFNKQKDIINNDNNIKKIKSDIYDKSNNLDNTVDERENTIDYINKNIFDDNNIQKLKINNNLFNINSNYLDIHTPNPKMYSISSNKMNKQYSSFNYLNKNIFNKKKEFIKGININSTFSYFCIKYCRSCTTKKSRINTYKILLIHNYLSYKVDFMTYLKKIQQIDLMKYLIFNNNSYIISFLSGCNIIMFNRMNSLSLDKNYHNSYNFKYSNNICSNAFISKFNELKNKNKDNIETELYNECKNQLNHFINDN